MGAVCAQLHDELGYDPDDGVPQLTELGGAGLIDVPVGRVVRARDGARAVAVARFESGRVVVVADECPHDGGRISDGFVDGERLVCNRHGWELEVCAGICVRAS
jgi:nitrite reductase/ring-hydroxylating ferredoxin subunit